jgi:hypothetical protein
MSSAETLPSPRYERTAGSPGLVILCAGALAACIAIVLAVAAWISRHHDAARRFAPEVGVELSFTYGPHERTTLARDWTAQDAAVREHLETYGWSDRAAGVARIPIDRAIDLVSREAAAAPRKESP